MVYGVKLGKLEKQVLQLLAIQPKLHQQAIQRSLNKPDGHYGAVLNACRNLEKKGFLKYEGSVSKKNVPEKLWFLTEKGIAYTLAYGEEKNLPKIIETYDKELPIFRDLEQIISLLSPKITTKLLRMCGKAILQYGEKAWAPETLYTIAWAGFGDLTKSEMNELRKAAFKNKVTKAGIQENAKEFYRQVFNES